MQNFPQSEHLQNNLLHLEAENIFARFDSYEIYKGSPLQKEDCDS